MGVGRSGNQSNAVTKDHITSTDQMRTPIVFVPMKDGTLRFRFNYGKLNGLTRRDLYPIPLMDGCIYFQGGPTVFSTVNSSSGYWQVGIYKNDRDKSAFTSIHLFYRLICVPFELHNAPGTFQRTMDVNLFSVRFQIALYYLNDITIFFN